MKKILMAMIMIAFAVASYGNVQVNWTASGGFYWDPSYDALLGSGESTYAQLMYSPDAVKDNIGLDKAGVDNDVIWDSILLTEGGNTSVWGDFLAINYQQETTVGYVYALIFQDSNVQAGDWYFHSDILELVDVGGITLPQTLQMNTDTVNGDAINTPDQLTSAAGAYQVVPEPATFLLVGMGGLVSFLVRRLRTA
jgi:hypothetical protein